MKQIKEMEYKVFVGGTVREMLVKCLDEGYMPLTMKEAYDWKKRTGFDLWVDTRTFYKEGVITDVSVKQLKSCKGKFEEFGRPLVVYYCDGDGNFGGSSSFNLNGRFVGVKKQ